MYTRIDELDIERELVHFTGRPTGSTPPAAASLNSYEMSSRTSVRSPVKRGQVARQPVFNIADRKHEGVEDSDTQSETQNEDCFTRAGRLLARLKIAGGRKARARYAWL